MTKPISVVRLIFFFVACVPGLKWWPWLVIPVWTKMLASLPKGFEYISCVNTGIPRPSLILSADLEKLFGLVAM
jgi:hypothetical protein